MSESSGGWVGATLAAARRELGCVALIARRELSACFRTPVGYIVAVLFTALQGFSFWYVLSALADPGQPAFVGAALSSHFGGSVLSMTVLIAVVAAIAMRLVAEDRRQGTWEALLTAPVTEGAVITGKWLGGSVFLALLWLPSLSYPFILAHYAAPTVAIDPGPVAAALLSVLLLGSALMAIGVAASAATDNQMIAALLTTVVAMLWTLAGDLPDSAPQLRADWPLLSAWLEHVHVRAHLDQAARGVISVTTIAVYLGVIGCSLALATTLAVWGRRRRAELARRGLACALVLLIAVLGNLLIARHPLSWDVTRAQVNTLAPETRALLDDMNDILLPEETVEVSVVRAGLDVFQHMQAEVDRLLARMAGHQPALSVSDVDPALQPARLAALAREFAIPADNLRDGGVVVFQRGDRRRAVDVWDMAEFQADDLGVGHLAAFRAEQAFASALAEVVDRERPTLCHSTGHGELAMTMAVTDGGASVGGQVGGLATGGLAPDWSNIAERVLRDGARLQAIPVLGAGVPAHCRVLLMAGPQRSLSPAGTRAVADFLARGGRLLLALSERADPRTGGVHKTGLELPLAEFGIGLVDATVIDPEHAIAGTDAWFTTTGYGAHAITDGFAGRRLTLWLRPRALMWSDADQGARDEPALASRRGAVLVRSSPTSFGETGAIALGPAARDGRDIDGPLAVAVAVEDTRSGARVVVLGAADSLSASVSAAHGGAGDLLVQRALQWLTGRGRLHERPGQSLSQVRLLMSSTQLTNAFIVCVVVMPGSLALLGLLVFWRRRRA